MSSSGRAETGRYTERDDGGLPPTGGRVISEEIRMRVIAEEPWSWFLLEEDGTLYLDVLVENGAISFSVSSALSLEEATRYADAGIRYLSELSSAMRHKALMRQWSTPPLPPGWAECSIAAIHKWQKRGKE